VLTSNSSKSRTNGCLLLIDISILTKRFWLRIWRVYGWRKRFNFIQCILARWLFNLRNPLPYRPINRGYFYCMTTQLYAIYRAVSFAFALKNRPILTESSPRSSALIQGSSLLTIANQYGELLGTVPLWLAYECSLQIRKDVNSYVLAVSRPWRPSERLNAIRLMTTSSARLRRLFWYLTPRITIPSQTSCPLIEAECDAEDAMLDTYGPDTHTVTWLSLRKPIRSFSILGQGRQIAEEKGIRFNLSLYITTLICHGMLDRCDWKVKRVDSLSHFASFPLVNSQAFLGLRKLICLSRILTMTWLLEAVHLQDILYRFIFVWKRFIRWRLLGKKSIV